MNTPVSRLVFLIRSRFVPCPSLADGEHLEPWDKLAYVVRGTALFAVADLGPESETFGQAQNPAAQDREPMTRRIEPAIPRRTSRNAAASRTTFVRR